MQIPTKTLDGAEVRYEKWRGGAQRLLPCTPSKDDGTRTKEGVWGGNPPPPPLIHCGSLITEL